MAKDYKIFNCKGKDHLAQCLMNEEKDGYELMDILWTGNIQPTGPPPGLIDGLGQQTSIAVIHLMIVIFVRPRVPDDTMDKMMGGKKPHLS